MVGKASIGPAPRRFVDTLEDLLLGAAPRMVLYVRSQDPATSHGRRGLLRGVPPPQEASSSARRGAGFYVLCSKSIHKQEMLTQIDQSD